MLKKRFKKRNIILLFVVLISLVIAPFTISKYASSFNDTVTIDVRKPNYKVSFNANGGTGSMSDEDFTYGTSKALTKNTFTKTDYIFSKWTTNPDGTGDSYNDEEVVNNLTGIDNATVVLYAQWIEPGNVARINNTYYRTLQAAIDDVSTDGTETTVVLLQSVDETITIAAGKNIVFDLQTNTIGNSSNLQTIKNYGTIKISNGTVTNTSAATNALIDNYSGGIIDITGGQFISLGTKQALYNEIGTVTISGNAYLSSKASGTYDNVQRSTVHNKGNGHLTITGGTIVNTVGSAVSLNGGTVVIGTKDNDPDPDTILIRGNTYGVYNTKVFSFYDGTIAGKTNAVYNESVITSNNIESNCFIEHENKVIEGVPYKTIILEEGKIVIFNPNGGTVSEPQRTVQEGEVVGTLPTPQRTNFVFDGWFTERTGGTQVTASTVINTDIEFFAHWHQENVAEINGTYYRSVTSAIAAVPTDGTETTITLLNNISENVTVSATKNIVFDLQNYTWQNSTSNPIITNNGKIKITNGTIKQTIAYAAINNETTGEVIITGGTITSTGERAALYNKGSGVINISGNPTLSSNSSGSLVLDNKTVYRATVMNINDTGVININGGTIIGTDGPAISNKGIINLGDDSDAISSSNPVVQGYTYGVKTEGTFNFYDGIIKGKTDAVDGTISAYATNSQTVTGTEVIGTDTYHTLHLTDM